MDREKVITNFEAWCNDMDDNCPVVCLHAIALLKEQDAEISNISNAYLDLVGKASKKPEIVRCKDCKDACIYSDDWVICTHIDSNGNDKHPADWFCADGRRKDEDQG